MQNDTRPEVAHDEKLLELMSAAYSAQLALAAQASYMISHSSAAADSGIEYGRKGYTITEDGRSRPATVADARPWVEALAAGTARIAPMHSSYPETSKKRLAAYDEAVEALKAARALIPVHEGAYTGWSRFFLVVSSAGHVHSSMSCSTCYPTTAYGLVPSLSGLDEAAAVAAMGETLCTVCFPSAPAKPAKITEAQALKLMNEGEAAFLEARAEYLAKESSACAGSGTFNYEGTGRYVTCGTCGARGISKTANGKLRKHQPGVEPK